MSVPTLKRASTLVAAAIVVAACSPPAQPTTSLGAPPGTTAGASPTTPSSSAPPATSPTASSIAPPTTAGATTAPATTLAALQRLALEEVASGLGQPTYATAPEGDRRLWVLERAGRVRLVGRDGLIAEPFLDITDRVSAAGIEQGLLGLAFHPDYAANGRFFVYYVHTSGNRRLAEFTASDDRADPGSERVLLDLSQPADSTDIRHYAGMLLFGPDGHLWVSLGDGANASGQGQNTATLFGKILRLDVDGGEPYGIPSDNPFIEGDGAPEVWAYGLRNPWRFSIDPVGAMLYVADVGLESREEIDVLPIDRGGWNLGWPNVEGTVCFYEDPCDPSAYVVPIVEYEHDEGCAITGGHVYRGAQIPEIAGHYFYSDWCTGFVRSFRLGEGEPRDQRDWTEELAPVGQVNAFGIDAAGELYVLGHDGTVRRLVADRG